VPPWPVRTSLDLWQRLTRVVDVGGGEWRQLFADGGFELERIATGPRGSAPEARPA
jgi:hypothetical protein